MGNFNMGECRWCGRSYKRDGLFNAYCSKKCSREAYQDYEAESAESDAASAEAHQQALERYEAAYENYERELAEWNALSDAEKAQQSELLDAQKIQKFAGAFGAVVGLTVAVLFLLAISTIPANLNGWLLGFASLAIVVISTLLFTKVEVLRVYGGRLMRAIFYGIGIVVALCGALVAVVELDILPMTEKQVVYRALWITVGAFIMSSVLEFLGKLRTKAKAPIAPVQP
jgi:cation transport ATPase